MSAPRREKGGEEKKYAQISPDSIEALAESVGIANLSLDVSRALSEDVSYRTRELAHVRTILSTPGRD